MALLALEAQRKNLVQFMFDEGMLDHQFTQLRDLQDENTPNFVAEIISLFCRNTNEVITELKKYLCEEVVDFEKLSTFVHQLKGSSSSIGAKQITLACGDLHQACDHKNKHGFLNALNSISEKYFQLEYRFQVLMQLEKRILDIEANPQLREQLKDGKYAAV